MAKFGDEDDGFLSEVMSDLGIRWSGASPLQRIMVVGWVVYIWVGLIGGVFDEGPVSFSARALVVLGLTTLPFLLLKRGARTLDEKLEETSEMIEVIRGYVDELESHLSDAKEENVRLEDQLSVLLSLQESGDLEAFVRQQNRSQRRAATHTYVAAVLGLAGGFALSYVLPG